VLFTLIFVVRVLRVTALECWYAFSFEKAAWTVMQIYELSELNLVSFNTSETHTWLYCWRVCQVAR